MPVGDIGTNTTSQAESTTSWNKWADGPDSVLGGNRKEVVNPALTANETALGTNATDIPLAGGETNATSLKPIAPTTTNSTLPAATSDALVDGQSTNTSTVVPTSTPGSGVLPMSSLISGQVIYDEAGVPISTATAAITAMTSGPAGVTGYGTSANLPTSSVTSGQIIYDDAGAPISTAMADGPVATANVSGATTSLVAGPANSTSSITAGQVIYDQAGAILSTATAIANGTTAGPVSLATPVGIGAQGEATSIVTSGQISFDDEGVIVSTATADTTMIITGPAAPSRPGPTIPATSIVTAGQVIYDDAGLVLSTATADVNATAIGSAAPRSPSPTIPPASIVTAGQVIYDDVGAIVSTATANATSTTTPADTGAAATNGTLLPVDTNYNTTLPGPVANATAIGSNTTTSALPGAAGIANGTATIPVDEMLVTTTWVNGTSSLVTLPAGITGAASANTTAVGALHAQTSVVNGTGDPGLPTPSPIDPLAPMANQTVAPGTDIVNPTDPALQFHTTSPPIPSPTPSPDPAVPVPMNGTSLGSDIVPSVSPPSSSFSASTQDPGLYTWSSQVSAHQDSIGLESAPSSPTSSPTTPAAEEISASTGMSCLCIWW
jgi:hypothetical protein